MDLIQTIKMFGQQHPVCIGLFRSGETPRYVLNIRKPKDFQLVEGGVE